MSRYAITKNAHKIFYSKTANVKIRSQITYLEQNLGWRKHMVHNYNIVVLITINKPN